MNKHLKVFLYRGLVFGGFGPIVLGIIFCIIEISDVDLALTGKSMLVAIISTYLLAFIQAGASVFNQIDEWPLAKSTLIHFTILFITYSAVYVFNSWIPFEPLMLLIFFFSFLIIYLIIWLTVYFSVKAHTKRLNAQLVKAQKEQKPSL